MDAAYESTERIKRHIMLRAHYRFRWNLSFEVGDIFEVIGVGKYEAKADGSIVMVDYSTETNREEIEIETGACWWYENMLMFQCSSMDDKRIVKINDYVREETIQDKIRNYRLAHPNAD